MKLLEHCYSTAFYLSSAIESATVFAGKASYSSISILRACYDRMNVLDHAYAYLWLLNWNILTILTHNDELYWIDIIYRFDCAYRIKHTQNYTVSQKTTQVYHPDWNITLIGAKIWTQINLRLLWIRRPFSAIQILVDSWDPCIRLTARSYHSGTCDDNLKRSFCTLIHVSVVRKLPATRQGMTTDLRRDLW